MCFRTSEQCFPSPTKFCKVQRMIKNTHTHAYTHTYTHRRYIHTRARLVWAQQPHEITRRLFSLWFPCFESMLERSVLAIRRRPRRTTNSISRSFVKFFLFCRSTNRYFNFHRLLGKSRIEKRQVNKRFFNDCATRSSLILRPIVPTTI